MVCFTGLAYFLVPQSVNRSIFLRKALFIASHNSERCKVACQESVGIASIGVCWRSWSFRSVLVDQGALGLWEVDVVPRCFSETPELCSLLRITRMTYCIFLPDDIALSEVLSLCFLFSGIASPIDFPHCCAVPDRWSCHPSREGSRET